MKRTLSLFLTGLMAFAFILVGHRLQPVDATTIVLPIPTTPIKEELGLESDSDPRLDAVQGLSGVEIADQIDRDYPDWTKTLPVCPCTVAEARQHPSLRDATNDYWGGNQLVVSWFHPGGEYDFRQRAEALRDYNSPTNLKAVPIRPGQQCIYDKAGRLINRGEGAGTPDIFGPEGTGNLSYHHDIWDVESYKDILENLSQGLARYHRTWKPSIGQDSSGAACPLNPEPEKRTGKRRRGRNFGDPHLFTFDGKRYSFQQVGEFVLSRSDDGLFEVQVRQAPVNSSLSVDSAVAMRIGGQRVALYADGGPGGDPMKPLWIDGKPVALDKELTFSGGGRVFRKGRDYGFEWPTGEELIAQVNADGSNPFLNLTVYVYESQANHLVGLLGNADGDAKDDLRFRSGTVLASRDTYGDLEQLVNRVSPVRLPLDAGLKLYLKRLTKDYGNDWRVSRSESLFDYGSGESVESFTLSEFPSEYLSLEQLSSAELNGARRTCAERRVEAELMEGCVFDVAFSGRGEFARAAARVSEVTDLLREFGVPVPDLEREIRRRIKLPWGLKLPRLPF